MDSEFWRMLRLVIFLWAFVKLTSGQVTLVNHPRSAFCDQNNIPEGSWTYAQGWGRDHLCYYKYDQANFGACNANTQCMCNGNHADDPIRGEAAFTYCQFLMQDSTDSWMYPFRGRHPNPPDDWNNLPDRGLRNQLDYSCGSFHYCLGFLPRSPVQHNFPALYEQLFKFAPYDGTFIKVERDQADTQQYRALRSELTNRLRFTDSAIAQEGISFCISGRHFKRSAMVNMDFIRGFLPLAERSFDIGNHIHPEDPIRMNRFELKDRWKDYFSNLKPGGESSSFQRNVYTIRAYNDWNSKNNIPQHWYENVFVGFTPLTPDPLRTTNRNSELPLPEPPEFINRPAHPDYQPGENCRNPYRVQVTTVEADGKPLHNYLHIKVYSENVGNPTNERCPTGRIKLLMLEVRDELGYPVGQFTDDIPCDQDDATLNAELNCPGGTVCRRWTTTKNNQMPCMFTHPKSTIHPSILMVSAPDVLNVGGGGSGAGPGQGQPGGGQGQPGAGGGRDFCRESSKASTARNPQRVEYAVNDEYFTEIHATWKYAQMNNGWVRELHFATMIIEDETPIQYYTSRRTGWAGPWVWCDRFCTGYKRAPAVYGQNGGCARFCYCVRTTSGRHGPSVYGYPDPEAGGYYEYTSACWYWHPSWSGWSRPGVYWLALLNRCVDENHNTNRPYGYTAQYIVLKPTFKTIGGWDNFQGRFIPPDNVNCHKDLTSGDLYEFDSTQLGRLPVRSGLTDFLDKEYRLVEPRNGAQSRYPLEGGTRYMVSPPRLDEQQLYGTSSGYHWERVWCNRDNNFVGLDNPTFRRYIYELPDWHTPGLSKTNSPDPFFQFLKFQYFGGTVQSAAKKMFQSAHQDPIVLKSEFPDHPMTEYFGSEHLICSSCPAEAEATVLQGQFDGEEQQYSLEKMAEESRCPCPFIPTTPPPELQTKTDVEIDGRQLHVINMLFAWMVLVPMAFFCARFYKETFSKVFFFQEFWWYTIHVLTLLTALLFTFGGIYGMKLKRDDSYVLVWTDATAVHIYTAYVLIGLFIVHLCIGPFRLYNPEWREIQIALHWGIGWVEYCLAIVVTLSATAIPSGIMNCYAFGTYCGFILFQIVMTVGMELHMRLVVDKELQLDPPREYMPPPMMRVFHRDAPHSKCRMFTLLAFVLGCVTFYGVMHTFLALKGGDVGCFQPVAEKPTNGSRI